MKTRAFIFTFVCAGLFLSACSPMDLNSRQFVGQQISPFAEHRVRLADIGTPTATDTVSKADETLPAEPQPLRKLSILVDVACAEKLCAGSNKDSDFSCRGLESYRKAKLVTSIEIYSFSENMPVGMSATDLEEGIHNDATDNQCVVGISDHMYFEVADHVKASDPPDPALDYLNLTNFWKGYDFFLDPNYAPWQAWTKIGVIDVDFMSGYEEISDSRYIVDTSLNFNVDSGQFFNIGGAPLAGSPTAHGMIVTRIVTSNKSGIMPTKLIATHVYSFGDDGVSKVISVDTLNNALAVQTAMKADVINMSIGGVYTAPGPQSLFYAISNAIANGANVVVAAGNSTMDLSSDNPKRQYMYPAAWGNIIDGMTTVGALNATGTGMASFSNYGATSVEVAAPGENILGAGFAGTSFSAPMVTAAIGLMKAYYVWKGIKVTPQEVEKNFLSATARRPGLAPYVINGAILDFGLLADQLKLKDVIHSPTVLMDNYSIAWTGTQADHTLRVAIAGGVTSTDGLTLGIYETDNLGLDPLASAPAADGTVNFKLPGSDFMVGDEGIWLVLFKMVDVRQADGSMKKTRVAVSQKFYPFSSLINTPPVYTAVLKAKIYQVNRGVEGWACLYQRPENIEISIRANSPKGTEVTRIKTKSQPKGKEYFDQCDPVHVQLGFYYPLESLTLNVPYYFVALHPGTATDTSNQEVLLNTSPIIITELPRDPILSAVTYTRNSNQVTFNGNVCWEGSDDPGFLGMDYNLDFQSTEIQSWLQPLSAEVKNQHLILNVGQDYTLINGLTSVDPNAQELNSIYFNLNNNKIDRFTALTTDAMKKLVNYRFALNSCKKGLQKGREYASDGTSKASQYFVDIDQDAASEVSGKDSLCSPNPINHYSVSLETQTTNNPAACTALGKTGIGQSFQWTTTNEAILESFRLGKNISSGIVTGVNDSAAALATMAALNAKWNIVYPNRRASVLSSIANNNFYIRLFAVQTNGRSREAIYQVNKDLKAK